MLRNKILAIILAGGEGSRLRDLTRDTPKPALPFGGVYSLIDFPLSNCVHSGIDDVWVVMQYEPGPLQNHLRNGRPWDLDRNRGGLRILHPHTGRRESGWHEGNADALYRHRRDIAEADPDFVLVLSADHIYTLNFQDVLQAHQSHRADVTAVVTPLPPGEDATRFGNARLKKSGRIEHFSYKPKKARSDLITTEIFLYSAAPLLKTLDALAEKSAKQKGRAALEDFGHDLFPDMVKAGRAYGYKHEGYWRDVGTPAAFHAAHMDLLESTPNASRDGNSLRDGSTPGLDPQDPAWPILTRPLSLLPARVRAGARVENALLSPGCEIGGEVENSVIGPRAVVENGAHVQDSVVLPGARIDKGTRVRHAIVLPDSRVSKGEHGNAQTVALVGETR